MTTILKAKLTHEGLECFSKFLADGVVFKIEKIALGDGSKNVNDPNSSTYTLQSLTVKETIKVYESSKFGNHRTHISAVADNPLTEYKISEIGFLTGDDKLIAFFGNGGTAFLHKLKDQNLLISYDLDFGEFPADAIAITGPGERLNLNYASEFAKMALANLALQQSLASILQRLSTIESRLKL